MSDFSWTEPETFETSDDLVDLIMVAAELEDGIEEMFVRELELGSVATPIVLKRISSVSDRMDKIRDALKNNAIPKDAQDTVASFFKELKAIQELRNQCVHGVRRDRRALLVHQKRGGEPVEITQTRIVEATERARELTYAMWFFGGALEDATIMANLIEDAPEIARPFFEYRKERGN